jgi:hypothetical protein
VTDDCRVAREALGLIAGAEAGLCGGLLLAEDFLGKQDDIFVFMEAFSQ